MTDAQIKMNPDFQRAMYLLENKIDSPQYLIRMWRLFGSHPVKYPAIERVTPWWKGIERLIR